jgi:peptide/nickel transport system substrate-binding protein
MNTPTQLAYIRSSRNEIALDLSDGQAESLSANRSLRINVSPGPDMVFLFANTNPQVSQVTADKHFENAVRDALDYKEMVALMGLGAVQARGVIPTAMFGALPAWVAPRHDLDAARSELAASGVKDPTVNLGFANDLDAGGVPISALASLVKADLGAAGIKVSLAGSPSNAAKADFDAGQEQMGLWTSSAAGSSSYLDFLPGGSIGSRAGWTAGSDPALESLGAQASTTADPDIRRQLLQQLQGQLNQDGPIFPLVQPGRVIVTTADIATVDYNPIWSVDLAAVTG